MKRLKQNWQVLPIYTVGVVWLLWAMLRGLSSGKDFFSCGALSVLAAVLVFLILKGTWGKTRSSEEKAPEQPKKTEEKPAEKSADPVVLQGRAYCDEIEELNEAIPDHEMSARMKQMTILTDNILDVVDKQPEKKPKIRQLINYYLPTVIKLLRQYLLLQEQEVAGGNIEASKEKICKMLMDINSALKKQLDNMFEADLVDITAEIRVMEKKLAAEGLTEDMN